MQLRDYQSDVLARVRDAIRRGKRRIIIHAPTGSGKTVVSAAIAQGAKKKGSQVLFSANRRELVFQAVDVLDRAGCFPGVIMAGEKPNFDADIQVCSQQTYVRRMKLDEPTYNPWFRDADIIIVDECTTAISPSYKKILDEYPLTISLGLTATPCRADGRGLGEYYEEIVSSISVQELIDQGYLVPCKYFCPTAPDLEAVRIARGDYANNELYQAVQPLIGDVFSNWARVAGGLQTIIFAVNVKHSIALRDEFIRNGVAAVHVDAKTPKEERMEALASLKAGETQVITNVGILCEGFDYPEAGCIVLARPTKSLGLYLQMAGRGLRPATGKDHVVLLDHGGCVEEHGLVEWDRTWALNGKERAWSKPSEKQTKDVVKCRVCGMVMVSVSVCPDCGTPVKAFGKKIPTIEAELRELETKGKKEPTAADKRQYLGMLRYWVAEKGYNPKMVNAKYRNRYGCWPGNGIRNVAPIPPDRAFLNLMKHDMIRFHKRKEKENAAAA